MVQSFKTRKAELKKGKATHFNTFRTVRILRFTQRGLLVKKKILSIIGLVLFVLILSQIDLGKFIQAIANAHPAWLGLGILITLLLVPLKAFKWHVIIRTQGIKHGFVDSLKGFVVGFAFSVVTPGRLGDLLRAYYLKQKQYSLGKGLSTVVVDRLIDVAILLALAVISVLAFSLLAGVEVISGTVLLGVLALGILVVYALVNKNLTRKLLKPFFNVFIPEKHKGKVKDYFHDFYSGLNLMGERKALFLASILIGLLVWGMNFVFEYSIAQALSLGLPFYYIVMVMPLVTLLDLLPISISGIGTRELALIFLLGLKGVSPESAVAFSLIIFFTGYLLTALLGVLVWLKNPIRIKALEG